MIPNNSQKLRHKLIVPFFVLVVLFIFKFSLVMATTFVTVNPTSIDLLPNATTTFTATTDDPAGVHWSDGISGSSLSFVETSTTTAIYTASSTPSQYYVQATGASTNGYTSYSNVYVSHLIPHIAISVSPDPTTLNSNATTTFTATTNDPAGVTWGWEPNGAGPLSQNLGGTINITSSTTAIITATSTAGTYYLDAISVTDGEWVTGFATVDVTVPLSVSITASPVALLYGATSTLSATTNDPLGVTWSVEEVGGGTVDSSTGLYTAPLTTGTYHVRATSKTDLSVYSRVAISVSNIPTVSINSHVLGLSYYATTTFSATTNDPLGLNWSVEESGGGTISSSTGLYTAPSSAGNYHVRATSKTSTSVYDRTSINVSSALSSIMVLPTATSTKSGQKIQFSAVNMSDGSKANVVWSVSNGFCAFSCPPNAGSIDQNGLYTASDYTYNPYLITVTSATDPTQSSVALVSVEQGVVYVPPALVYAHSSGGSRPSPAPAISISPTSATVVAGKSLKFTATISGAYGPSGISWSVLEGPSGGTISNGNYTAPVVPGVYHVVVSNTFGTDKATVNVIQVDQPPIVIPPSTTTPITTTLVNSGSSFSSKQKSAVVLVASSTSTSTLVVTSTNNQIDSSSTNGVLGGIKAVGQQIVNITTGTIATLQTPGGRTAIQTVNTVGAVTGISTLTLTSFLANPLFASPLTVSEIFLVPLRLWGLALSALGLKRKKKPWGTVYDSVTKQPIDPAFVTLVNEHGKEVATSTTDMDGRFGFFVPKGTYYLKVKKSNYTFPSKKLAGKESDDIYHSLYFGEKIEVAEDGAVIYKNIPMDQENFDWNEFAKSKMPAMKFHILYERLSSRLGNGIFWVGFFVACVSIFVIPHVYSITIFCLYILLIALRFLGFKPKVFGEITDHATGNPLSFASISVFSEALNQELFKKIADKYGRYYILVPKGEYEIKVARKNRDESYTNIYDNIVNAKNGVINRSIKV